MNKLQIIGSNINFIPAQEFRKCIWKVPNVFKAIVIVFFSGIHYQKLLASILVSFYSRKFFSKGLIWWIKSSYAKQLNWCIQIYSISSKVWNFQNSSCALMIDKFAIMYNLHVQPLRSFLHNSKTPFEVMMKLFPLSTKFWNKNGP